MRVLVVEDDARLSQGLRRSIEGAGFVVDHSNDGEDAWFKGSTETYAAIVLDLGLPSLDGLTVLKRWRAEGVKTPVLILSARGSWAERVDGIDTGADDYLPKPFQAEELLARLRALVRRTGGQTASTLNFGPLQLDLRSSEARLSGEKLSLTALEFKLLQHLALKPDDVVSKEELAEALYASNHDRDSNAIEAVVSRMRRKIGVDLIESKRGFGYQIKTAVTA